MGLQHLRGVYTTEQKWHGSDKNWNGSNSFCKETVNYYPFRNGSIGAYGPDTERIKVHCSLSKTIGTVPVFVGSVPFFLCRVNAPRVSLLISRTKQWSCVYKWKSIYWKKRKNINFKCHTCESCCKSTSRVHPLTTEVVFIPSQIWEDITSEKAELIYLFEDTFMSKPFGDPYMSFDEFCS